ncbi:MAG: class I SAM-dependent methyltransferase [Acidilobaceae archaeon]
MTLGGSLVPFVPTRNEALEMLFKLVDFDSEDVFYDLGCGDGRVVVEVLKRTAVRRGVCIESRRDLIEQAIKRAQQEEVLDRFVAVNGDIFETPIGEASVVYIYLLTSVNDALKPKLSKELKPGSRVVSLDFQIPGWKPVKVSGFRTGWQSTMYYYVVGESDR